jgi:hypothetical protein
MGKWFPGIRTATKEQAAAYRDAQKNLDRNSQAEYVANGRRPVEESERYLELNRATAEAARPLSTPQRIFHFHRSLAELDRETGRQQREKGRQARSASRAGRSR